MSPEQQSKADAILADCANPEIPRQKVLHRASELGQHLSGDARYALVEQVYALLAERDHDPGNALFVRGRP